MRYYSDKLGLAFDLPDKLTVRQVIGYRERVAFAPSGGMFTAHFDAVRPLLAGWECKAYPDPTKIDLDSDDLGLVDVVVFVANTAASHMSNLDNVPKNV